jgi:hypothetical protein
MGRNILDNVFLAQEFLEWATESGQDLVLLLLDFEKAVDKIEWGFLFTALSKLDFSPKWIKWISCLYRSACSSVKVNGERGGVFKLSRLVRQGCPLAHIFLF